VFDCSLAFGCGRWRWQIIAAISMTLPLLLSSSLIFSGLAGKTRITAIEECPGEREREGCGSRKWQSFD